MSKIKKEFPRLMMVSDDGKKFFTSKIIEITELGYAVEYDEDDGGKLLIWKYHKEIDEPKPKKKKLVELLRQYNLKNRTHHYIEIYQDNTYRLMCLSVPKQSFKSKKELKKYLIKEIERNEK